MLETLGCEKYARAKIMQVNVVSDISGSHGGEYEDDSLLRYCAM
jgi:hypothetical protein